jgi:hypothetical protein
MRLYDIISTIFFLILGVGVIVGGVRFGFGEWGQPGPGFICVLSGVLLSLFSGGWLLFTLVKQRSFEPTKSFFCRAGGYKNVAIIVFALMIYIFLMGAVGFMIATFIFLIFLFKAIGKKSWKLALTISLLVTISSILVFQLWLGIPFPEGPFNIQEVKRWMY